MEPDKPALVRKNSTMEEWSDQRCFVISRLDTFPEIVKDTNIQKNIISRFLNFYLGGKCQKGLTAGDLIYAVISIMPISLNSEEFIWDDEHYSERGTLFFLTPDDKLKVDIANVISKIADKVKEIPSKDEEVASEKLKELSLEDEQLAPEINQDPKLCNYEEQELIKNNKENEKESQDRSHSCSAVEESNSCTDTSCKSENDSKGSFEKTSNTMNLQWFRQKYDVKSNVPNEENSPASNAAFCINCNRLLDQWESSINARNSLKYFFAMAALIVMRCRVKTYQNIIKYFSASFFKHIYPTEIIYYTTPHRGFIKKSWKALHEPDVSTQIMFAKLVINSLVDREKMHIYGKNNILTYAILSHTANYGMGIISMLQLLAAKTYYNFDTLFKSIYSEDVAASWNAVNDFFKNYLCRSAKQHTFHWARLIESDQFEYLSCSNNYGFAVVIAVFIEEITKDSGIWRSAWVDNEHLDTYKQLGAKMYNSYQEKIKNMPIGMQLIRPEVLKLLKDIISGAEKKKMDSSQIIE